MTHIWEDRYLNELKIFVKGISDWEPDYVVPVARKSCKLLRVTELPKELINKTYYLDYFEFFDVDLKGKRVAIIDDATQFTSTFREYADFFERKGAVYECFAFSAHKDLLTGNRPVFVPKLSAKMYFSDASYYEYLLKQSIYLREREASSDLDHISIRAMSNFTHEEINNLYSLLGGQGFIYDLGDYPYESTILGGSAWRFSLHKPFFAPPIPRRRAPFSAPFTPELKHESLVVFGF